MRANFGAVAVANVLFLSLPGIALGYEINNHADMSQEALNKSVLATNLNEKLLKVGLRQLDVASARQTFPLDSTLPEIRYCFGEYLPSGGYNEYRRSTSGRIQDETIPQPDWGSAASSERRLTIAQLFRYGACFEDSEEPTARPLAHFYNPQDSGAGLTVLGLPAGPSSLDWMLKAAPGNTTLTGVNHYNWQDARYNYYYALTGKLASPNFTVPDIRTSAAWGRTFQALAHVTHHLQDMASPQHVRNDAHCSDENKCRDGYIGLPGTVGLYRPSGYETYFDTRFQVIRNLAESATTPTIFGLPREFWNANTDNNLVTTNPVAPRNANQGLAAYTSTNFVSAGKDFRVNPLGNAVIPIAASGLPFPRPAQTTNDVAVTTLFAVGYNLERVRTELCGGDLAKCKIRFVGTETDPTAKASSLSAFSQELLRPAGAYTGAGVFQQNFFTYTDAAIKLVPKAVEYSAGLIDYFFRGEFEISLPTDDIYSVIDLGNPASNCKDSCGFTRLRMKVRNTTAAINGAAQNLSAATLRAVVKFSRNSCYTPNQAGEFGDLNPITQAKVDQCLLGAQGQVVEEIVVSNPIAGVSIAASAQQEFAFDFPTPLPINSWDIRLQVVALGTLGAEVDAVAVGSKRVGAPVAFRNFNETDWIAIDEQLYTRAVVAATPALIARLPPSCRSGAALSSTCFPPSAVAGYTFRGATGRQYASLSLLAPERHFALAMLGDDVPFPTVYFTTQDTPLSPISCPMRPYYLDAAADIIYYSPYYAYRGLHAGCDSTSYYFGAGNAPSVQTFRSRPPLANPTPVPMTSFNF